MTFKETVFRAFYHHFTVVPVTEKTKPALQDFPGADAANGILTYGYYDRQAGLSLAVLAAALVGKDSTSFARPVKEIAAIIRIGAVEDDEFLFFDDKDGSLAEGYADRIETLQDYDAGEDIEKTRQMSFLDGCRDRVYIDDVLVYLFRNGLKPEGCWTRITGLGDHYFLGELLNEPDQDFGFHKGETISFVLQKKDNDEIICCSDMNPMPKITREDLEDGTMLEEAIHRFNTERSEASLISLLFILRDSYVWIPCNAVISERDQDKILGMIDEASGDPISIIGDTFTTDDEVRLIPDILQRGDEFYFPAFSTVDVMGEYGEGFSKMQKHLLEAIVLAKNNDRELTGIVVNAFSEPFILNKELWDSVTELESRIQD